MYGIIYRGGDRIETQLKKGLIDVCVLAILFRGDSYGWQIIKDLSTVLEVSESTLYPVLKRLELGKLVTTYEQPYNGRLRKYFKITRSGEERLRQFEDEHEKLTLVYNFILGAIKNNKEEGENL